MKTDSSISSGGEGNTRPPGNPKPKQISPAKRWCFVFHNWTEEDLSSIVPIVKAKCCKAIIGSEFGEKGETPHLQGFLYFKEKVRPKSVFEEFPKINWRKAKGNDASQMYCAKEGDVRLSIGFPKPLKLISPTRGYQKQILDIIKEEPDDRSIYWFFGEGNIGKTQFSKYLTAKHDAICLSGKGADVRNGIVDHIENHSFPPELVVFPIPKSYNTDYLSYEALENVKDMYFYSGKYKGGMVIGNSPHLIVFSNNPPDREKLSPDRWKIFHICEKTYECMEVK